MGDFDGKAYLVTGAGKGIGAVVAQQLSAAGASIAAFDIDQDAVAQTANNLVAGGGRAIAIQGDARTLSDVQRAVDVAVTEFGGLDGLAAIAGVLRVAPTEQTPTTHWRDVVETNVLGPFQFSQAVIPELRDRGGGSIVLAASAMAFASTAGSALYSASKGAVVAMTRALAVEFAAEGIRVNCVAPGTVRTPMARDLAERVGDGDPDARVEEFGKAHPMGRIIEPEEVANVVTFLLGSGASAVTGSCYLVDAGMLASLA